MDLITIDREKCKRDGFCAEECPMKIIRFDGGESYPEAMPGAEELCISCGHCIAVCPHGALTLRGVSPDSCAPVQKALMPSAEQAGHFMRTRRSARVFKDKTVDRELIEKAIDIARYAPSGHNSEPVNWLVVYDTQEALKLAGLVADWMRMMVENSPAMAKQFNFDLVVAEWDKGRDRILRGGKHLVIVHAERAKTAAPPACTIALAHFELAAYSLGFNATWAGFVYAAASMFPPMVAALGIPKDHQVHGAMFVGYPKFTYKRIPPRKEARITWKG